MSVRGCVRARVFKFSVESSAEIKPCMSPCSVDDDFCFLLQAMSPRTGTDQLKGSRLWTSCDYPLNCSLPAEVPSLNHKAQLRGGHRSSTLSI